MRKYLLIITLVCGIQVTSFAQSSQSIQADSLRIDSLQKVLPTLHDTARINCLNSLGHAFLNRDGYKIKIRADSGSRYSIMAKNESQKINYRRGIAYSMINLNEAYFFYVIDNNNMRIDNAETFSEAQLPLVYNHKPTGRGDDYNNLSGLPLFPFGFGLSYANFEYTDIQLDKNNISKNELTTIRFKIKNTGKFPGEEVVQLCIRDLLASVVRPVMELKGFQRIHVNPGETKEVVFTITPEMLSMLDKDLNRIIEPGDFRILIGSSSRDIRLKTILTVKE